MTPPMTATPAQPAAITSPTRAVLMPPMARIGTRARARDFGETLAADFGAVARLARRLKGGSRKRIVGGLRIDRLGFGDGVDRHADELSRTHAARAPRRRRFRTANARHRRRRVSPGPPRRAASAARHVCALSATACALTRPARPRANPFRAGLPSGSRLPAPPRRFQAASVAPGSGRSPTAAADREAALSFLASLLVGQPRLWEICALKCVACVTEATACRARSTARIVLAGVLICALGWASPPPVLAAKHKKPTGACAQSGGRCVADCDQLHWCQVYTCVGGKSTRGAVLALL